MKHRTTDPACRHHRAPRTWLERWWFDRARGRGCPVCVPTPTVAPSGPAGDSGVWCETCQLWYPAGSAHAAAWARRTT